MEGKPLVPVVSNFTHSPYRKLKRTKYLADGRAIKMGVKTPDARQVEQTKQVFADAAKLPPVQESEAFDFSKLRLLGNRMLLKPEFVTVEDGVDIPEGSQKEVPFPAVVACAGPGCDVKPGDRVVFKRTARHKDIILGKDRYWLAKSNQVIARVV